MFECVGVAHGFYNVHMYVVHRRIEVRWMSLALCSRVRHVPLHCSTSKSNNASRAAVCICAHAHQCVCVVYCSYGNTTGCYIATFNFKLQHWQHHRGHVPASCRPFLTNARDRCSWHRRKRRKPRTRLRHFTKTQNATETTTPTPHSAVPWMSFHSMRVT